MKNILKTFTILIFPLAFSLIARAAVEVASPTACPDWSKPISFELAVNEYMNLSAAGSEDFGCISRASWMAVEDLFKPENAGVYSARLGYFDSAFSEMNKKYPKALRAFDDLKILFQLRWLTNNYEGMKEYKSSRVITGVAGATAATVVVGGAALVMHKVAFAKLGAAVRPAVFRMIKYLGALAFARATLVNSGSSHDKNKGTPIALSEPPLELLSSNGQTFWNYTDLHLMNDLASITAEAAAAATVQATVAILALRYFGAAAAAGGIFSASSIIGFIVAYPIGRLVGYYTDKAITNKYHRMHAQDTARLVNQLKSADLTDWQRYMIGAEITSGSITWVSTQDLYLQKTIETKLSDFARRQICQRLAQHDLVSNAERAQLANPNFSPLPNLRTEAVQKINQRFKKEEEDLRVEMYMDIEDKRARLLEVRQGVLNRMVALESTKKNYLRTNIIELRSLLDRIDRYLIHDTIAHESLSELNATSAQLSVEAGHWSEPQYVQKLKVQYSCQ